MTRARARAGSRAGRVALACALAIAAQTSCASAGAPMGEVAREVNATLDPHPDRFLPGDSLLLRFAHDPNLDQTVRVDPSGRGSFLLVGTLPVAGRTPQQLGVELQRAYASKLAAPELSVTPIFPQGGADEPASGRAYYVLGEVKTPGSFPFVGESVTLVQALARAGSFEKTSALLKQVLLVRWMPEERRWQGWKVDARQEHWRAPEQILLQTSDVVFVPQTPIDKVNIWIDKYIRQMIPFPYLIPPVQ